MTNYVLIFAVFLSGCASFMETFAPETAFNNKSPEEQASIMKERGLKLAERYGPVCEGLGITKDSPDFPRCVLSLAQRNVPKTINCRETFTGFSCSEF